MRLNLALISMICLSACRSRAPSSDLLGVRAGNSKLVLCDYKHPFLGGKRVEHYALYEARRAGLEPLSLDVAIKSRLDSKGQDTAYQSMILESIRHLDTEYFGLLEGLLKEFDQGKNVDYDYANHLGNNDDPEEQIKLPKDGFTDDDGKLVSYNPRYSPRVCRTNLLIHRKTKSEGGHF